MAIRSEWPGSQEAPPGNPTMQQSTIGRFVLATLLVVLGTSLPAAAIDLSGDYVGFALVPFTVTFVQTGTALQMSGHVVFQSATYPLSATGTVDPATGTFSVTGEITPICPDFVYSGTGDGEEIPGTFASRTCPSGPVFLTKCGNGVVDHGEDCDPGSARGGGCCSECRPAAAGTACDDGNACTIGDVCAGNGACVGSPAPAGQECHDDSNPCTSDVCDAAGMCTHVPVPPEECRRAVACHSTCAKQLKACRQTCPGGGQARRECRAACAARSTCTAPGAPIRTLAYVVTECSTDPRGRSALKQKLLIRRGNCDPSTVAELDEGHALPGQSGWCRAYGEARSGSAAEGLGGLFQRLAVLPNGSGVVFEVTSQWSRLPVLRQRPEGFFFVRSNGKGLRYLGPPSGVSARTGDFFPVSPDGRYIALTDFGPDGAGHVAQQIFRLDTRSGQRRQLTYRSSNTICCASFVNNRTIIFHPLSNGVNSGRAFEVKTNGRSPEKEVPSIVLPGGGHVVTSFEVVGANPRPLYVYLPDRRAIEPNPGYGGAQTGSSELFLLDGKNLVQLTNFDRADTDQLGAFIARGRILFAASANPLGENPAEICQLFSIDTRGTGLRQVTHLPWDGRPSTSGCAAWASPACSISNLFVDPAPGPCSSSRAAIPSVPIRSGSSSSRCGRMALGCASSRARAA